MIRVTRDATNRPPGFQARARERIRAFRVARKRDPKLTAAKHWTTVRLSLGADVDVLVRVFRGKCAFCESRMEHVSRPHVEHYRPKGRAEFEARMFDWDNWLLSCGRCNDTKWAHFPVDDQGAPLLLNPTADDPSQHLMFEHAYVGGVTERGRETVRLLGLARGPLEDERARWLLFVDALLLLAVTPHCLREARDLLVWCTQPEAPWSACVRAYLSRLAPKLVSAARVTILGDPEKKIRRLVEAHGDALRSLE